MLPDNALLLTADIQTGKTTTLRTWASTRKTGGFLTPIIGGKRCLMTLPDREIFPMEKAGGRIAIGRYQFDEQAFKRMERCLEDALDLPDIDWLIIDEIGPLEIYGHEGLEPFFSGFLQDFQETATAARLLIVVRQSETEAFMRKYGKAQVISPPELALL